MPVDLRPIARALLSVSDKTGLVEFARALQPSRCGDGLDRWHPRGDRCGGPAVGTSPNSRFPEMMDGRVKTLNPKVHGGLLAGRENPDAGARGWRRHRADRPGRRQSVSVRGDGRQGRVIRRSVEKSTSAAGDDPRGGQEPRRRGRAERSGRIRWVLAEMNALDGPTLASRAAWRGRRTPARGL